jgi:hypothetical protein
MRRLLRGNREERNQNVSSQPQDDLQSQIDQPSEAEPLIENSSTLERQQSRNRLVPSLELTALGNNNTERVIENSMNSQLESRPSADSIGIDNDQQPLENEQQPLMENNQQGLSPKGNRNHTKGFHNYTGPLPDFAAQNERIRRARKLIENPFFCCFQNKSFLFGYDIKQLFRNNRFEIVNPGLDISKIQSTYQLGIFIKSLQTFKNHLIGLVKPFVRIHILDIETGFYYKPVDNIPIKPRISQGMRFNHSNNSNNSNNNNNQMIWNEHIQFEYSYASLVNEQVVYLFEIIDEQPSLSLRSAYQKNNSSSNNNNNHNNNNSDESSLVSYHKIAWAYLLPIGLENQLNVALPLPTMEIGEIQPIPSSSPVIGGNSGSGGGGGGVESSVPPLHSLTPLHPPHPLTNVPHRTIPGKDLHIRLQLYEYQWFEGLCAYTQRSRLHWPSLTTPYTNKEDLSYYPTNIPPIYVQFKSLSKQMIEGAFMRIAIGPRWSMKDTNTLGGPNDEDDDNSDMLSPTTNNNKTNNNNNNNNNHTKSMSTGWYSISKRHRRRIKNRDEKYRLKAAALRRMRGAKEPCLLPDRFLYRLEVSKLFDNI